jgi:peptidoglycan hydrolase-like protein with peptidoglycan-binding domain
MRRTGAIVAAAAVIGATAVAGSSTSYGALGLVEGWTQQSTTDRGEGVARPTQQAERPVTVSPVVEPRTPRRRPEQPALERPVEPGPEPAGPALIEVGAEGPHVRELQARLRQIAWFFGDVTDFYGDQTRAAVAGFQVKRGFEATGAVDQRTLSRLQEMTSEPTADELANVAPDPADGAALDPRCLTGRVLCVDKSSSSLRWVVDGDVQVTLDARFGGNGYFTREGQFSVFSKSREHVSSLYETSMPFAMFFSGGQAVHYSPDFAANGYYGASHGCVNIRDYDEIAALFDQVQLGDRVVVYWA